MFHVCLSAAGLGALRVKGCTGFRGSGVQGLGFKV